MHRNVMDDGDAMATRTLSVSKGNKKDVMGTKDGTHFSNNVEGPYRTAIPLVELDGYISVRQGRVAEPGVVAVAT